MTDQKHLYDIDLLRALAVLVVVVFHINKDWLPGGFVGVDVFFVISGYLITGIVMRDLQRERFTYPGFQVRRIKRILPAYFGLVIATLVAALFLFSPPDFVELHRAAISAFLFKSNYHAARQDGYFAPQAEEQPLLHLWSLGVEIQFYLLWPVLLLLLFRLKLSPKALLGVIGLAIAGSVIYAQWLLSSDDPEQVSGSYFFLGTRSTALLVGSWLNIYLKTQSAAALPHKALQWLGLIGLLLSVVWVDGALPYPGVLVLLPSVSTALFIAGQNKSPVIRVLTHSRPVQWLGLRSYSVYLYHWPTIVFTKFLFGQVLTPGLVALVVGLTALLSALSYRLIERPAITSNYQGLGKSLLMFFGVPLLLAAFMVVPSKLTEGLPFRSPYFKSELGNTAEPLSCYRKPSDDCGFTPESQDRGVLFIGDSHGAHFEPLVVASAKLNGKGIRVMAAGGCEFIIPLQHDSASIRSRCRRIISAYEQASGAELLVVAGRWDSRLKELGPEAFTQAMGEWLDSLHGYAQVNLLLQIPKYDADANRWVINKNRFGLQTPIALDTDYQLANDLLRELAHTRSRVVVLDPGQRLCEGAINCLLEADSLPLYKDDDHLNVYGAQYLKSRLTQIELQSLTVSGQP